MADMEDLALKSRSVLMLAVISLTRSISPDHPFMSHFMDVMTEMNTGCSDHHKRSRFDQIKNDWKMCSHHLARCELLSFVISHR